MRNRAKLGSTFPSHEHPQLHHDPLNAPIRKMKDPLEVIDLKLSLYESDETNMPAWPNAVSSLSTAVSLPTY